MNQRKRLTGPEARLRILQAAARAFREHGLATTVDQIAEEAGYSTSALYKHFENRDAILDALSEELHIRLLQIYDDLENTEPFEKKLRTLIRSIVAFAKSEEDYFAAVLCTTPRLRMNRDSLDYVRHRKHLAKLEGIMAQGRAQGVLTTSVSVQDLAELLRSMLDATGAMWAADPQSDLLERVDRTLDLFLGGAKRQC